MGALWARLVPTVIALAIYFCFADAVLILQCLYYKKNRIRKPFLRDPPQSGEDTDPLMGRANSDIGLPGSRRRPSASYNRQGSHTGSERLLLAVEDDDARTSWVRKCLSVILICIVGIVGWAISWKAGFWVPTSKADDVIRDERVLGAELLGYLSAACYLGYNNPVGIRSSHTLINHLQCKDSADHQKLSRAFMRRSAHLIPSYGQV